MDFLRDFIVFMSEQQQVHELKMRCTSSDPRAEHAVRSVFHRHCNEVAFVGGRRGILNEVRVGAIKEEAERINRLAAAAGMAGNA